MSHRGFENCIREHAPDVVVSMHPLCQAVPVKVLRDMQAQGAEKIPFVTVVTDLATPHPLWIHKHADLCIVPSQEFDRAARVRGLTSSQIRMHGLPVRPAFGAQPGRGTEQRAALQESLGLVPNRKTVLVVGGGDGVGNLGAVVDALGAQMASQNAKQAVAGGEGEEEGASQLLVVCGKNAALKQKLEETDWGPHLHVVVEGFTTRMSDFMASSDVIVTKAGPGTIAEACCCGLPILLSGHLPGQETGNINFVVDGGFGAYDAEPESIASTVCGWLEDEETLRAMSERSKAASRPSATGNIADDIVKVIDGRLEEATPPIVRGRRRPASEWRFGGPAWRQQRTPALA